MVWLITLLAAALAGFWCWFNRDKLRQLVENQKQSQLSSTSSSDTSSWPPLSSRQATSMVVNTTKVSPDHSAVVQASQVTQSKQTLLAPKYTKFHAKSCPKCQRLFPDWMVVCTVDGSTLEAPMSQLLAEVQQAVSPVKEKELERMMCVRCTRRYGKGVKFCGVDGTVLMEDNLDAAAQAKPHVVCQRCGGALEGEAACLCEKASPLELDPSQLKPSKKGGFVMLQCTSCHRIGPSLTAYCPHDGELMMPVDLLSRHTFPERGWGEHVKVCEACGRRFSGGFHFCTHDGHALTWLD